ncbi:MAG: LysE family translocator [Rhodobacteraceae bacterium]|nr:LysE family translocator [Paracoccaceae bacterium]
MSITAFELLLYAGAMFILFLTPGPVWVALIARAMSGGFHGAWPLALGVVIGDGIWPVLAIFGVSYLVTLYADFVIILRYFGAFMFLVMGILLLLFPDKSLSKNKSLTKPGMWAGFVAGLLVIMGNPKAILFYMGVLPGFFDFDRITTADIIVISLISMLVPFLGNVVLALMVDRVRLFLSSPLAIRRMNISAGVALVCVGLLIALT